MCVCVCIICLFVNFDAREVFDIFMLAKFGIKFFMEAFSIEIYVGLLGLYIYGCVLAGTYNF